MIQPFLQNRRRAYSLVLTAVLMLVSLCCSVLIEPDFTHAAATYVVAKDGSGNYATVQAAIDAVPANNSQQVVIYIKNGTYNEVITVPSNKPHITLFGQSASGTIITYNHYNGEAKAGGGTYGTGDSATALIQGNNFNAVNLTFQNSHGSGAQAVAVRVMADQVVFKNCRLIGYQDTLYADNLGRQYYVDSYIEGAVDFIFGNATAVFENDEIHSVGSGYITAQSRTSASQTSGYVISDSRLTTTSTSFWTYLGRPWRPYARVIYLSTAMAGHILPAGWDDWGDTANEATAYYAEYQSSGPGANPSARVSWSHQLTASQAASYTVNAFLNQDGWLTSATNYINTLSFPGSNPTPTPTHTPTATATG